MTAQIVFREQNNLTGRDHVHLAVGHLRPCLGDGNPGDRADGGLIDIVAQAYLRQLTESLVSKSRMAPKMSHIPWIAAMVDVTVGLN
jgi:hypothetical protein